MGLDSVSEGERVGFGVGWLWDWEGDWEGFGEWERLGGVVSGIQYGGFECERVDLRVGE